MGGLDLHATESMGSAVDLACRGGGQAPGTSNWLGRAARTRSISEITAALSSSLQLAYSNLAPCSLRYWPTSPPIQPVRPNIRKTCRKEEKTAMIRRTGTQLGELPAAACWLKRHPPAPSCCRSAPPWLLWRWALLLMVAELFVLPLCLALLPSCGGGGGGRIRVTAELFPVAFTLPSHTQPSLCLNRTSKHKQAGPSHHAY